MPDLFNEDADIADLFPHMDGVILMNSIWRTYVVPNTLPVPYFHESDPTVPLITRHPLNHRDVDASLEDTVSSVLRLGILFVVSSRTVLQQTRIAGHMLSVGAATHCNSVYEAKRREPDNPYVLATIAAGIQDPVILRMDTPKSVIRKIILEHNDFHAGAPNTYVQRFWFSCVTRSYS